MMTPIKTRRFKFRKLPKVCKDAVGVCHEEDVSGICEQENRPMRLETYKTEDIVALLKHWMWSTTLAELDDHDLGRVNKIIDAIPTGGHWPYVSTYADDTEMLWEVEQVSDDPHDRFTNHGDGWHRMLAAIHLNLPTIDILFFE